MTLADGLSLPRGFRVLPLGVHSGKGEDDPISNLRAARDGWASNSKSNAIKNRNRVSRCSWTFDPPLVTQKMEQGRGARLSLKKCLHAVHGQQGRWYLETAELSDRSGRVHFSLGRVDWTDFDHNGDLLYAKDGCLFRLVSPVLQSRENPPVPSLVVDLNEMKFEPIVGPQWAKRWP
jgi:hypothetical protein